MLTATKKREASLSSLLPLRCWWSPTAFLLCSSSPSLQILMGAKLTGYSMGIGMAPTAGVRWSRVGTFPTGGRWHLRCLCRPRSCVLVGFIDLTALFPFLVIFFSDFKICFHLYWLLRWLASWRLCYGVEWLTLNTWSFDLYNKELISLVLSFPRTSEDPWLNAEFIGLEGRLWTSNFKERKMK